MEFGRRLLPQVVDFYARTDPGRVYASIPVSTTELSQGFRDVTMSKLAAVVNRLSWWLEDVLGSGDLDALAYIGPADIRYAVMLLAAVKCNYKMMFISPRNRVSQNQDMILRTGCLAVFYAEEMVGMAEDIRGTRLQQAVMKPVPCVTELLSTAEDTRIYQYEKSFEEAQDEPCLILHTSGSTGDPKLVTMTHGTFACTDNDRNMPVPEGRAAQNASLFNFEGGGKFYSCFPPYHLAGVHAYIDLPIFSSGSSVVFGPSSLPPTGYLLSEIMKYQHVRAFYVPPFIIEQWAAEPVSTGQAQQLDFVLYGGGPLSPSVGHRLSEVTRVCQMYGSLEVGQVQLLVPKPAREWSYMELNPFEGVDMQPCGDGIFEMVLHQNPKLAAHRSLWHNFPHVKEWRTGDLFTPHPSKPGLWRFNARVDDLIVLSSSYKLRPLEMETLIQASPVVSGALIVGQGRPEPLLIVETKAGTFNHDNDPNAFIDLIWPMVEEANGIAPSYAKISRSRILVADPQKPFVRAPKGSIVRKLTSEAYAGDIDQFYSDENSHYVQLRDNTSTADDTLSVFMLSGLKKFVRKHVQEQLHDVPFSDTANIFIGGLDSLGAAALSRSLQRDLAAYALPGRAHKNAMTLRLVYKNPTIEKLARIVLDIITNRKISDHSIGSDTMDMEKTLEEFTKNLPQKLPSSDGTAVKPMSDRTYSVALIGPRGSLGPNILEELLKDSQVTKIYCLNRGNGGRERMRSIFKDRNFSRNIDDERLSFVSVDLGKPHLGLSSADLEKILSEVQVFIHNAWRVDFSWTLDSYKDTYLRSICELVNISSRSLLRPRIAFVSSVSSVQEWNAVFPDKLVTEAPLESYKVASPLGYGQSKHVAERILARACSISGIPITILRVGQVAGPTNPGRGGGTWSPDEWIPSLAAVSKTLGMIPADIPPIDWVPVDLAARAIVDLVSVGRGADRISDDHASLKVFNVVNPHVSDWSTFARALQRRIGDREGGNRYQQWPLAEWVDALVRADLGTMSKSVARSSTKILPFFQHLAETASRGVVLHPRFDTAGAVMGSKTMKEMQRIDEALVEQWLDQWGL